MVAKYEHVTDIERCIRNVKERLHTMRNMLPFKKISTRIIIEILAGDKMWLNIFIPTGGISTTTRQITFVKGIQIDYKKHFRIEFGSYTQTHEYHDNVMGYRKIGYI